MAPGKRGLQRGLKGRWHTVILFLDSTILTEIPPLRAMWAPVGEQARVPIAGPHHAKRVITGVVNIHTGTSVFTATDGYTQEEFQDVLPLVRTTWRGWRIILFLDRHAAHTADLSRELADELGIVLRWLPTACSELNVVDHLWRFLKGVLANEPTPDLEATVDRALACLAALPPLDLLRKAGVLSDDFWLKGLLAERV